MFGYPLRLQLINVYFSASYALGKSTFIISQGVSTLIASAGKERKDFSGSTTVISYIFDPGKWLYLFGQVRRQGTVLMLSAGVGF